MQFSAFLEEMLFLTKCVTPKYMPHLWDIRRKCGNIYQNRKNFATQLFPLRLNLKGK